MLVPRPGHRTQSAIAWILLALVVLRFFHWVKIEGDFAYYLVFGELILGGEDIYVAGGPATVTWPPMFGLMCVPFSLLARTTPFLARGTWVVINILALWAILKMLVRMVFGTGLAFLPSRGGLSLGNMEVLVPLILSLRFILSNFDYLQVNILILVLTLSGLYLHSRGCDVPGGVLIGLAGALKVMPALFVPYLFYRRRFMAGFAALGSLTVFTFLPGFVFGFPRLVHYLKDWPRAAGLGWGVDWQNQSLYAMLDRFLGHGVTPWNASRLSGELDGPSGEPVVVIATACLIGLITLVALVRSRRPAAPGSRAALAEYGIVFIMSVVFCPLTWKSYFVVLMCPLFLLTGALSRGFLPRLERGWVAAGLIAYFILAGLTPSGIVGRHAAAILQTLSVPAIAVLIILAVLIFVRPVLSGRGKI